MEILLSKQTTPSITMKDFGGVNFLVLMYLFFLGGEDVLLPLVTWGQGKEGYLGNGKLNGKEFFTF